MLHTRTDSDTDSMIQAKQFTSLHCAGSMKNSRAVFLLVLCRFLTSRRSFHRDSDESNPTVLRLFVELHFLPPFWNWLSSHNALREVVVVLHTRPDIRGKGSCACLRDELGKTKKKRPAFLSYFPQFSRKWAGSQDCLDKDSRQAIIIYH